MPSPRCTSVLHFTKEYETLKKILVNGFWPRFSKEDHFLFYGEYLHVPMVSFCDIPISRLDDHAKFYGEYGIGLRQSWAELKGLNPVFYLNAASPLRHLMKMVPPIMKGPDEGKKAFAQMLCHLKPIKGLTTRTDGVEIEKEFLQECEWRFVPDIRIHDHLGPFYENDFNYHNIDDLHRVTKVHTIKFDPYDVTYIWVKNESEIPLLFDYLIENLGNDREVKRLVTRIATLKQLQADI